MRRTAFACAGVLLLSALVWVTYRLHQQQRFAYQPTLERMVRDPSSDVPASGSQSLSGPSTEGSVDGQTKELRAETYVEEHRVPKNSSVFNTLKRAGIEVPDIHRLVKAAKSLFDLAGVRTGTALLVTRAVHDDRVVSVTFQLSKTQTLALTKMPDGGWKVSMQEKPMMSKELVFSGEVSTTLWTSASEAGLEPSVIYSLADIFGSQIDFQRELSAGDAWTILVERNYVDGQPYSWGNILLAEYVHAGEKYTALRYPLKGVSGDYYSWEGQSLRGTFLKSPLKYSRVSSRFQAVRFHPILGVNRPHRGVDFAAPANTPVFAVGDGKVTFAARKGPSGNMIQLKHTSRYETAYKHLSAFAKGIKKGAKVVQGQIIGYVGATGLASGPHLHFEFYEDGNYVDPLGKKFPREEPIVKKDLAHFKKALALAKGLLAQRTGIARR